MIELLVVIAILAAILFPVFARARENARRSSCQSNLKQIGLGLIQYVQDYDETMPFDSYGSGNYASFSNGTTIYKWMDAIQPYVKSTQIFNCPSDPQKQAIASDALGFRFTNSPYVPVGNNGNDGGKYGSHAINVSYYQSSNQPPCSHHRDLDSGADEVVKLSAIAATATTVWVADTENTAGIDGGTDRNRQYRFAAAKYGNGDYATLKTVNGTQYYSFNSAGALVQRHLETTNVLYVDGHVKAVKLADLAKTNSSGTISAFTIADD